MPRLRLLAAPLAAFALLLTPAALPSPAQACINGVRHKTSDPTREINKADQALARGRLTEAWRRANEPIDRHTLTEQQLDLLTRRATRIRALAVIRNRDEQSPIPRDAAALTRATHQTRDLLDDAPDDPSLLAEHAEALARDPATQPQARKTLEDLAQRDLLASPFAWRTLAELRAQADEPDAAKQALQRCQTQAADAQVCTATQDPSRGFKTNVKKPAPRGAKSAARAKS